MVHMAVYGSNEFVVGFQLAGIRTVIEATDDIEADIEKIMQEKEIGLVVIDQMLLDKIDADKRMDIEDSVEPVFIPVSEKAEQGSLRRLIKKSIGIDLWDQGE